MLPTKTAKVHSTRLDSSSFLYKSCGIFNT